MTGVDAANGAGAVVAKTTSDAGGRFALALPAGQYTLQVVNSVGFYPLCGSVAVTVQPGQQVTANISCDTGIR